MSTDATASYVQQLTGCQSRLYAYVYSLLNDAEVARDVLQETNMALWRKAKDYDATRPFLPWAFGVAFHQVRAARTRLGRDRLMFHDERTLETITKAWHADAAAVGGDLEIAMDGCLKKLSARHHDVVVRYYKGDESLASIAATLSRTANAVGVMLHRVRQALARCIEKALGRAADEEAPEE